MSAVLIGAILCAFIWGILFGAILEWAINGKS